MGALGLKVNKAEDIAPAIEKALEANRPTVINILVDGTQLAPPFRKDALKKPTRYLEKYKHLDHSSWKE